MKIPRYWASQSATAKNPQGETYTLKHWGYSDTSLADAQNHAAEKLRRVVEKLTRSGLGQHQYAYASGVRREELIETIVDADQQLLGAITRNRYGALVLNTARLLIADVDQQEPGLLARFKALFGRQSQQPSPTRARIDQFQQAHPEYTLRIYQTHSGYRVMIVNQEFEPQAETTRRVFDALNCDPLYVTLCRAQDSFRARLTPKPWRCDSLPPPNLFPRETAAAQQHFERWLADYQRHSGAYAVCELAGHQAKPLSPAVARLVHIHDQYVLHSGRPLA